MKLSRWHNSCFILTAEPVRRQGFQCSVTAQWKQQQHCYCTHPSTALNWIQKQAPDCKLNINEISISSLGFQATNRKLRQSLRMCQSVWKKTGVRKWGILYFTYITSQSTIPSRRGETPNNHFIKRCYTNKPKLMGRKILATFMVQYTLLEKLQWQPAYSDHRFLSLFLVREHKYLQRITQERKLFQNFIKTISFPFS